MIGLRIDEFYAMTIRSGRLPASKLSGATMSILLCLRVRGRTRRQPATLLPSVVIVPVYNKIRLSFTDIHAWASDSTGVCHELPGRVKLEWDIHLTSTNEYKFTIREKTPAPMFLNNCGHVNTQVHLASLSSGDGKSALEMLGDATDIVTRSPSTVLCGITSR